MITLAGIVAFSMLTACTGNSAKTETADNGVAEEPECWYNEGDLVACAMKQDGQFVWLKDNDGTKLNPASLFSDASDSLINSLGLNDGIPASVSMVLYKAEGKNILFDAGLGPKMGGHLTERLATVGLTPDSIDMIYLTHLHPDHIGGMMGEEGPLFPRAEVYVGAVEYDAWINQLTAEQAGLQHAVMGMYAAQLHQFAFGDTLPCGVVAMDAVGHTPGHTVFQHGKMLIVGDLLHGLALQESHPEVCANFDQDKEKAVESRRRIFEYAKANGLTMVGMHFPEPGFKK